MKTITTNNYIDGFVLPINAAHLEQYQKAAEQVAQIWIEYGAIAYYECLGEEMSYPGIRSFKDTLETKDYEVVIFGWAVFPSKKVRDEANKKVSADPRMREIVGPLMNPDNMVFDASRMTYGGFKPLVYAEINSDDN